MTVKEYEKFHKMKNLNNKLTKQNKKLIAKRDGLLSKMTKAKQDVSTMMGSYDYKTGYICALSFIEGLLTEDYK